MDIRYVQGEDKAFWLSLDRHLVEAELDKKIRDRQGYVLWVDDRPVGLLQYNLFWDNTPFCTLLYVVERERNQGYGQALMTCWEKDMAAKGYHWILVSTQTNESAQDFYRKLGYQDCGGLLAPDQPMELFLCKTLQYAKA